MTILAEAVENRLSLDGIEQTTGLDEMPPLSSHVGRAVQFAADKSKERGSTQIQSRDLLYGALSVEKCSVTAAFRKRGILPEQIDFSDGDAPRAGGGPLIAGYNSDRPGGEDLLDITGEVESLVPSARLQESRSPDLARALRRLGHGQDVLHGEDGGVV